MMRALMRRAGQAGGKMCRRRRAPRPAGVWCSVMTRMSRQGEGAGGTGEGVEGARTRQCGCGAALQLLQSTWWRCDRATWLAVILELCFCLHDASSWAAHCTQDHVTRHALLSLQVSSDAGCTWLALTGGISQMAWHLPGMVHVSVHMLLLCCAQTLRHSAQSSQQSAFLFLSCRRWVRCSADALGVRSIKALRSLA